jgi:hypothetical protein
MFERESNHSVHPANLGFENKLSSSSQAVASPPAAWVRIEFFNQRQFKQTLYGRVQRTGSHPELAVRKDGDLLHNRVPMVLTLSQREEDKEHSWCQGKQMLQVIRYVVVL